MRVIAGEFRSRVLKTVPGMATRPTPDRLRESLFSILAPRIEGAIFADLYAGTGAVGIEALSRGAAKAIFVESDRRAARVIRENLRSLGIEKRAEIHEGRVPRLAGRIEWGGQGIVFLDPPYAMETEYAATLEQLGTRAPGRGPALVIVQHSPRMKLEERYGALECTRVVKQGDNALSFYQP